MLTFEQKMGQVPSDLQAWGASASAASGN
jgi:hypothetical protein